MTIWHYDNGSWKAIESGFNRICDIHFVGNKWIISGEILAEISEGRGMVMSYDGKKLSNLLSGCEFIQNYWLCVFFIEENEGWVAGAYASDTIFWNPTGAENMLHYLNGDWHKVEISNYRSVYGLYFIDKHYGWAVGKKGYILKYRR